MCPSQRSSSAGNFSQRYSHLTTSFPETFGIGRLVEISNIRVTYDLFSPMIIILFNTGMIFRYLSRGYEGTRDASLSQTLDVTSNEQYVCSKTAHTLPIVTCYEDK